jgi:DNA polymerase-3 subunit epsilon
MLGKFFGRAGREKSTGTPLTDLSYVVVDVETTGLYSGGHDRIVEIAMVTMESGGRVTDEYTTLVNPRRDVGATHIHGLTMEQLTHAPVFEVIAGDVIARLRGRVLVAHNARFDWNFLDSEFRRARLAVPPVPSLCTMTIADLAGADQAGRRLVDLCAHFGVAHQGPHAALLDARATAAVFARLLSILTKTGSASLEQLGCQIPVAGGSEWPAPAETAAAVTRGVAGEYAAAERTFLARMAQRLASDGSGGDASITPYLDLLDRALEDRRLSPDEKENFSKLGVELGLGRKQMVAANRSYFDALVLAAWADGRVTEAERQDLHLVAAFLDIPAAAVENSISGRPSSRPEVLDLSTGPSLTELKGKTVCFTGALRCTIDGEPITREFAESAATNAGLRVHDSVTKKLDLLVVADPESASGKAEKARKYGTRVLAEAVFWQALGVRTD